jgi:hypothetical protein
MGPPRTLFSLSRESSSRSNQSSTHARGPNSGRNTQSNRSRHSHDSAGNSPEWESKSLTSSHHSGYGGYHNRNYYKNNSNNNSHNHSSSSGNNNYKNSNDSNDRDLLEKFEALGRERRGDAPSTSKIIDDNNEPEWLDPTEDVGNELPVASGHSIREFEEWKARMKAEERSKAGLSEEVKVTPSKLPHGDESQSAEPTSSKSVDRLFGMWDSPSQSDNLAALGRSSRFSRFFKGDAEPSSPSGMAPPGLSPQPDENIGYGGSKMFPSASSPMVSQATPAVAGNEADKKGFMRIMAMLGDNNEPQPNSPVASDPPTPALASSEPTKEKDSGSGSNDAFFMSLLNKNTGATGNTGSPIVTTQSPIISSISTTSGSRNITPASQHSHIVQNDQNGPKGQVQHMQQQRFAPPGFNGPPPEWIQQQMTKGQFPPNGPPPPGFMPMMPGMPPMPPPGMLPPNFGPGQHSMPSMPPMPHGQNGPPPPGFFNGPPPPGNFFNGPPPHMNFPMQQQNGMPPFPNNMNGQFPPGIPVGAQQNSQFGMVQKGSGRN